jgi:uncharacterized protein YmfQ (DUF2313 family)
MTTPKDRHIRRIGQDYGDAFLTLLPQGQAWPKYPGTTLDLACRGLADYWGFVDGRAADLLEIESDPRYTVELLPDWERNWDLPDECLPTKPDTPAARQHALVTKMTLLGAQSRDFFKAQGILLGEYVTIREYAPYMCGVSRVGDTRSLLYGDDPTYFRWQLGPPEMRYYWTVEVENVLSGVECIFNRYRPAHTDVVFTYSSVLDRAVSTYYFLGF